MQPDHIKQYKDSQIARYQFTERRCPRFRCQMGEMPSDVILEGQHKSKLQNSVQLWTVMALYDQDVARNNGTPN